jgi:hypothetical protein
MTDHSTIAPHCDNQRSARMARNACYRLSSFVALQEVIISNPLNGP